MSAWRWLLQRRGELQLRACDFCRGKLGMSSSVIMVTSKGLSQNTENSAGVSGGGLRVALAS